MIMPDAGSTINLPKLETKQNWFWQDISGRILSRGKRQSQVGSGTSKDGVRETEGDAF